MVLKECSERVVSFSSSEESYDTFYFWLIGFDFDKLDRKLEKYRLDIDVIKSEGSKLVWIVKTRFIDCPSSWQVNQQKQANQKQKLVF